MIRGKPPGGAAGRAGVAAGACRRDSRGVFFGGFATGSPAAPPAEPAPPPGARRRGAQRLVPPRR